jgi:acyl carrier protein
MNVDYESKIKKIIADKAGVEPSEIHEESYFEDDLNLGDMELVDIIEELEEEFHIDLADEKKDIETVGDLIEAIAELVE